MVCMRNIASLLLAVAAAPSVMGNPLVLRADPLTDLLTLGDDNTTDSGSVSSTKVTSSAAPPRVTTTPTSSPQPVTTTAPGVTSTPQVTTPTTPAVNSPTQVTTPPVSQITSQSQSVMVVTNSQGSVQEVFVTVTTSNGAVVTITSNVPAPTADAGSQGSQGGSTSQPDNHAALIGGLVGGIGGAILLAGIGAVIYRVWGKNRHRNEEDDGLMGDGVYGTSELKGASGASGPSPFTNNLEQYHTPGKANPSANF